MGITILVVLICLVTFQLSMIFQRPALPMKHKQVTHTGKAYLPAVSPDGNYIAFFSSHEKDFSKVMKQEIEGSNPIEVFDMNTFGTLKWSPDGTELLITGHKPGRKLGGYLVSRFGNEQRKLPELEWQFACWAPDGKQIAHAMNTFDKICFTNKHTEKTQSVVSEGLPEFLTFIDWSPIGDLLLLTSYGEGGHYSIWAVSTDLSRKYKIIEHNEELYSSHWSPNGNAIYYLCENGHTKDLMKLPVDSKSGRSRGTPSILISGIQMGGYFTLSKDRKKLLYTRELNYSNLWLFENTGKGQKKEFAARQLTKGTDNYHGVSISPGGKTIAFSKGRLPTANIFTMPITGGKMEQLTFMKAYNTSTVWSPNGKEIAFGSIVLDSTKVWHINKNGGIPQQYPIKNLWKQFISLSWNPGPDLLYKGPDSKKFQIFNPSTNEIVPLIKNDIQGYLLKACFSADCKKVAVYWIGADKYAYLLIVDYETRAHKIFTKWHFLPIGWSNDDKWIYVFNYMTQTIERLNSITKQRDEVFKIPPDLKRIGVEIKADIAMTPDGNKFVYVDNKTHSDVWVVENFDPDIK